MSHWSIPLYRMTYVQCTCPSGVILTLPRMVRLSWTSRRGGWPVMGTLTKAPAKDNGGYFAERGCGEGFWSLEGEDLGSSRSSWGSRSDPSPSKFLF